jgi:hypothetical protein
VLALRWFARRRRQSMLRTLANAAGYLPKISPTDWAIFICAVGAANVWLPWFIEPHSGLSYSMKNQLAYCLAFLVAGFLLFVTGRAEKLRILRILAILAAASVTLVLALVFILDLPRSSAGALAPPAIVSVGLSTALLLIGTLELRGWLASTAKKQ